MQEYRVTTSVDGPYTVAIQQKTAEGFLVQLYRQDGTAGADVTGGRILCPGLEGFYPGAGYYPGQDIGGVLSGPKVDLNIV